MRLPVRQEETSTRLMTMSVLIDGATGYIGSHLAGTLTRQSNCNVSCLVRKDTHPENIHFLRTTGSSILQANLDEKTEQLSTLFSQADIACHLIGSISPKRGETAEKLHIHQTEYFVRHCLDNNVKQIVMVSACGADSNSDIAYQRTKWQAEQIIKQSGIPAVILRPSLIIGKTIGLRNSKLIARLQDLITNKPSVPLVAGGHNKIQPIFIADLIDAIIASFNIEGTLNCPVFELGGPQIITLRELAMGLMQVMNIEKSIFDLPAAVAMAVAYSSETLQEVPILSKDQVKLSQRDNICLDNQLVNLIKRAATPVEEALSSYKNLQ